MAQSHTPRPQAKVFRVIIVDDEELARRGMEIRLQRESDIEICKQCHNGREAVQAVHQLRPDIVFLDVQMPGMDGFETLREFSGPDMPHVVFVTAFSEYAIKAFDANAIDYLLKPIDDQRLKTALDRVRRASEVQSAVNHRDRLLRLICEITGEEIALESALDGLGEDSPANTRRIAIKDGDTTVCIDLDDVDWIEAAGDYLCVHARGKTHVMRGTMKRMEQFLDEKRFARVHRSTIINIARVQSIRSHINGEYFLSLEGAKEVKVSRSYRDSVQKIAGDGLGTRH